MRNRERISTFSLHYSTLRTHNGLTDHWKLNIDFSFFYHIWLLWRRIWELVAFTEGVSVHWKVLVCWVLLLLNSCEVRWFIVLHGSWQVIIYILESGCVQPWILHTKMPANIHIHLIAFNQIGLAIWGCFILLRLTTASTQIVFNAVRSTIWVHWMILLKHIDIGIIHCIVEYW